MKGLGKVFIVGASLAFLAACGTQLEKAEGISPSGSGYDVGLYDGYVNLAKSETGEGDYLDSDVFAIRAINSGTGKAPQPEEISNRSLPDGKVSELSDARARLVAVQGNPASRQGGLAGETATAQVMFDCWMQEQEENFQPDDIERCRAGFYDKIAALEDSLKPKVAAAPPAKPDPLQFVVYFNFDKAELTPESQAVVAEAEAAAKKLGGKVDVAGMTDTVGSNDYNDTLSGLRAGAVAKALSAGGVSASKISTEAYGKRNLAVPTADGVNEPKNRRAVIVVQPQ